MKFTNFFSCYLYFKRELQKCDIQLKLKEIQIPDAAHIL
jgi:hypothetical protein